MTILDEDISLILNSLTDKEKNFYKNATVLITGGAGAIGFELINFFVEYTDIKRLIVIDNCCLGKPKWITHLEKKKLIEFYCEDICKINIKQIHEIENVTHIFHMASVASPVFYRKFPLETMDAGVDGCRKLLEYFKNKPIKSFCFFSSSEIYGFPGERHIPTSEEQCGYVNCIGPRACYDESKRYSETLCYVFAQKYNIPCVILRPFNIFGPGLKLNDGRIPADCINAISNGHNITLYSDGMPTRTFCYILDAIVWILKAAAIGRFDVFNIGIEKPEISIKDFAQMCIDIAYETLNYKGSIVYKKSADPDYLTHNPLRRCPDLSYASKLLNYSPQISTREGIKRYIDFINRSERDELIW